MSTVDFSPIYLSTSSIFAVWHARTHRSPWQYKFNLKQFFSDTVTYSPSHSTLPVAEREHVILEIVAYKKPIPLLRRACTLIYATIHNAFDILTKMSDTVCIYMPQNTPTHISCAIQNSHEFNIENHLFFLHIVARCSTMAENVLRIICVAGCGRLLV